jgi:Holliday junction DNA helicase RuvA
MIAFLRGRVLDKHPNRIIVDVSGVGYEVSVPLSTFYTVGDVGSEISVHVHTHVREDQLALFGFATPLELTVFDRLIAVSGIGPKLALAVLSGIEPRELISAVHRGDHARLTRIPGVGKKTAERIVIELRDRLPKTVDAAAAGEAVSPADNLRDDLVSALTNLGYHAQAIDKVLEKLLDGKVFDSGHHGVAEGRPVPSLPERRFEDLLREALKDLSRG